MILRNTIFVICILLCSTLSFAENNTPFSISFDASFFSQYIDRGLQINSDAVFQPSLTIENNQGFGFNLWANYDLTNKNDMKNRFSETEATLYYSYAVENIELTYGFKHAFTMKNLPSTDELQFAAKYSADISPFIGAYLDIKQSKGFYLLIGAEKELPIMMGENKATLAVSGSIAYGDRKHNNDYYSAEAGFADAMLSIALPIELSNNITLTPQVDYYTLLDKGVRRSVRADDLKADNFVVSITATYNF
ncbi:MAG: hypothetical protein SNJ70_03085 [Armatimonadota bacterium]